MNPEFWTWVRGTAAGAVVLAIVGLLGTIVKTAPTWRKVDLDGDAGLRADMAKEIAELRREMRASELRCKAENGLLTGQVYLLGRALFLVTGEAESVNPASLTVAQARNALQEAFPLHTHAPADMMEKAQRIDGGSTKI